MMFFAAKGKKYMLTFSIIRIKFNIRIVQEYKTFYVFT